MYTEILRLCNLNKNKNHLIFNLYIEFLNDLVLCLDNITKINVKTGFMLFGKQFTFK